MTWFKVDDSFHSHPKVLAAAPAALGLWVVAGSWSGANLSDGFVPDHVLPRLLPDGASLAQQLVTAGLWKRTRGGYRFHDWNDFNPQRSEVEEERKAARERMRAIRSRRREGETNGQRADFEQTSKKGRAGDQKRVSGGRSAGQQGNGSGEQPANVRGKFVTPTRPDPNPLKGGSGSGGVRPSDAPDPQETHPYVAARFGECETCGLPQGNRRHLRLVAS